jgi:hypothetical protein
VPKPKEADGGVLSGEPGPATATSSAAGYRKPPTKSQFKKGQSGNPRGRPKSKSNIGTVLVEALDQKVRIKSGGKEKKVTKEEAMLTSLVNRALKGEPKALRALAKLAEKAGNLKPEVERKRRPGVMYKDDDGNLRPSWATPEEGRIWRARGGNYNGKNWNGK